MLYNQLYITQNIYKNYLQIKNIILIKKIRSEEGLTQQTQSDYNKIWWEL